MLTLAAVVREWYMRMYLPRFCSIAELISIYELRHAAEFGNNWFWDEVTASAIAAICSCATRRASSVRRKLRRCFKDAHKIKHIAT